MHESEVAQLCPVLVSPWTAAYQAPPSMGFSMDGDSPWTLFRVLEWVAIAFSETYKTTTHSLKKKKKKLAICDNMDRSWGHCVEWKKWDRKRQISYDFAHGWAWALQRQWDIVHAHAQLCPTLCDPMDCSPSDSSGHGIFQARILEWGAISSFRASSWLRDWTCCLLCLLHCRGILYPLSHQGSPFCSYVAHMKNK